MSSEWSARTFGVEEEYLLLDPREGTPVNRTAEVIDLVPQLGARAEREYLASQLETSTPVCHEADEAEEALSQFRATVAAAAASLDVVLAGTGVPPAGGEIVGTVTPRHRYQVIEAEMRGAAAAHYSTGTHVHVNVPTRTAGVQVLSRIGRWSPVLLALTANSPIWCGQVTGFSSWRHVKGLVWPVSGYPDGFGNAEGYRRSVDQLIRTGIVPDTGALNWVARLSENYPTIELRIADAQLFASDAVAFAVIVRSLVTRALHDVAAGVESPRYAPGMLNGANWIAGRNGLGSDLVDPLMGQAVPAFELVERMLRTIERELRSSGDRDRVHAYIERLQVTGGPASQQLEAFENAGIAGLIRLYREGSPEFGR